MDPYLEDPAHLRGVHAALIVACYETLNATLPDGFIARIEEKDQRFIKVVSLTEPELVITAIEFLSLSNKTPGSGREEYVRKQQRLLRSETHFLEIDLLRAGRHTVAAAYEDLRALVGHWDYVVSLHRAGEGGECEARPRTVRQVLPSVPVPLTANLPEVRLDIQTLVDHVWERGPFRKVLNYQNPPIPPLSSEDTAWAVALLR